MDSRESLKNVSLGTSKINYLDPRYAHRVCAGCQAPLLTADARARSISVAWCKRHDVPIEKIYTKVLLEKFGVRARLRGGALCACVLTPFLYAASGPWRWSRTLTSELDVFQ